ncbi:MAG: hypothetical protein QOD08_1214, partial [Gaiellaceae bacterium]|nr:hypothetical protein [Gaiellaceae bacterium]
ERLDALPRALERGLDLGRICAAFGGGLEAVLGAPDGVFVHAMQG